MMRSRRDPYILACVALASFLALRCVWFADRLNHMHPDFSSQAMHELVVRGSRSMRSTGSNSMSILLRSSTSPRHPVFQYPTHRTRMPSTPNYNGINVTLLDNDSFHRLIDSHDENLYASDKAAQLHATREGERSVLDHDAEQDRPRDCERNNWRSSVYMNCNAFHEMDLRNDESNGMKFLGGGYYRYAWLMTSHYEAIKMHSFVLKMLQLPRSDNDNDHLPSSSSFSKVHHEAIIMERLSASPTIVDIYGHCATSIMAQNMPEEVTTKIVPRPGYISQEQLDQRPTLSQNNLTIYEKLDIALVMAESMAEMHGFVGGVMVHGDIHPDQYLRDAEGGLRLNDYNNAEILDWNVTNNQHYCKTDRGAWGGMYRAPEEFRGDSIDEQIDVYALGNNLYTLLTGLWPFYEHESHGVVQRKVHGKERPFIDERYRKGHAIEQEFVQLMEKCWEHAPEDRPSVFQIMDALRLLNASQVQRRTH